MKTLTIQVPDEVYAACERIAARTGRTVEECVMEFLLKHGSRPAQVLSEEQRRQAKERIERYLGAGCSGDPFSADSERIEEDLVREAMNLPKETH